MADTSTNRVVLDYTSRDFAAIRSLLVGIGQGLNPEWVTLGEAGDFGTLLIELMAYMGDTLNYYIDRVGSEAFLGTAQRRLSVLYMADMLGYRPIGQQAATVVLSISLSGDAFSELTIPSGTRVGSSSDSSIVFETDYDITVTPGSSNVLVSATEGISTQVTVGSSKGAPNSEFILPDPGVIFQSVSVQTREGGRVVDWSPVQRTVLARPTQSAFSTYVDDKGYTHLLFGDNAAGRIPPLGADIVASYRYGVGAAANALASGTINTLVSATMPTGLTITNFDRPIGGADQETIDAMRFSIPRATSIQDRAVTLNDYINLTVQVPGVAKAVATGQVYSAVTLRIAPVAGDLLASDDSDTIELKMSAMRNAVEAYLLDKVLLGSNVFVEDIYQHNNQGWEDVVIDMDVYVLSGYNRSQTVASVQAAVETLMAYDSVDFGQRISIGDVYRTAMAVAGVDYIELNTLVGTTGTGPVSNVVTPADRIPRIRPELLDGDDNVVTPYGFTLTGLGGLVNT